MIFAKIAVGSLSIIWLAIDMVNQRFCAIKILKDAVRITEKYVSFLGLKNKKNCPSSLSFGKKTFFKIGWRKSVNQKMCSLFCAVSE